MPKDFDMCRSKGGKIRTKDLGKGKYMHICFHKGKSYAGEVKTKSTEGGGMGNTAAAIAASAAKGK